MALLFIDGFDHYATADIAKKWSGNVNCTINSTAGRSGGGALVVGSGACNVKKQLPSTYGTLIVGFRFQPNALSSNNTFFKVYEGATDHVYLKYNFVTQKIDIFRGNGTQLGSSTSAITLSVFTYIEVKIVIHDTTGSVTIRLNGSGTADVALTGIDTRNGGTSGVIDTVYLGDPDTIALSSYFDDLYIVDTSGSTNNDFLGDCRVDLITPNGDGNYSQFTPSTGTTHYTLVDESTPNTTDYNDGVTVGDRDSYAMSNLSALSSQTVYGVQVCAAVAKDDAGAKSATTFVRSSSTNSDGASASLSTSQQYISQVYETDPNGSIAWTESSVNAMEAGVKVTA